MTTTKLYIAWIPLMYLYAWVWFLVWGPVDWLVYVVAPAAFLTTHVPLAVGSRLRWGAWWWQP